MQSDNFHRERKTLVLDVLKTYGKLEEIIEQISAWLENDSTKEAASRLLDSPSNNEGKTNNPL
jgi:hypothetical protein